MSALLAVLASVYACRYACMRVRACVRACVHACVRACVRAFSILGTCSFLPVGVPREATVLQGIQSLVGPQRIHRCPRLDFRCK